VSSIPTQDTQHPQDASEYTSEFHALASIMIGAAETAHFTLFNKLEDGSIATAKDAIATGFEGYEQFLDYDALDYILTTARTVLAEQRLNRQR
jgi:hypothetical protein